MTSRTSGLPRGTGWACLKFTLLPSASVTVAAPAWISPSSRTAPYLGTKDRPWLGMGALNAPPLSSAARFFSSRPLLCWNLAALSCSTMNCCTPGSAASFGLPCTALW
jgi:hypothetical protein